MKYLVSLSLMVLLFTSFVYVAEAQNFYIKNIYILDNIIYTSVAVANVDADSKIEVVAVGYSSDPISKGFLQILELTSDGLQIEFPGVYFSSTYIFDCTVNDFNEDGVPEIAVVGARLSGGTYRAFLKIISYYYGYADKATAEWNIGFVFDYDTYARAVAYGNISNAGLIRRGIVVVYDGFDEMFDIPIGGIRAYSFTGNSLTLLTHYESPEMGADNIRYTDVIIDDLNVDRNYEILASGYIVDGNLVSSFVDLYVINSSGNLTFVNTNEDIYTNTNLTVSSGLAVGEMYGSKRIYVSQHIFDKVQNKSFVGISVKAFDGSSINDITNLFWSYGSRFAESVDVIVQNVDMESSPEIIVLSNAGDLIYSPYVIVLKNMSSIFRFYKYQLEESTTKLMGASPVWVDINSNGYVEGVLCGYFSSVKGYIKVIEWDEIGPSIPVPEGPIGTWLNNTNFTMSWKHSTDTQSGVSKYTVQIATDANFSNLIASMNVSSNNTQYSLTEGKYYWRVRAIDKVNNPSNWSIICWFGIDISPPSPPQLIYPQNSSVLPELTYLKWIPSIDNLSGVKNYEIVLANNTSFNTPIIHTITHNTTLNLSFSLNEGEYYWKVRAIDCANNVGPWSNIFTFTIMKNVLPSPTLNSPANGTWYNISLLYFDWNDVVSQVNVKHYEVQIDRTLSFASPKKYYTPYSNLTLGNFAEGLYYWRVRGIDINNISGMWSDIWSFGIDVSKPLPVTLLAPVNASIFNSTTITFRWSAVSDLSGIKEYTMEICENIQFNNPIVRKTKNTTLTLSMPSGKYYWRVRAEDIAGNVGDWSSIWTFSVDFTSPSAPRLISPENNSWMNNPRPKLLWSESLDDFSAVAYYHLQVSSVDSFTSIVVDEITTSTTYSFTYSLSDGKYFWRVRAFDNAGNPSRWSAVYVLGIDTIAPPKPRPISPIDGVYVSSPLMLEWERVEDTASGTEKFEVEVSLDSSFSNIIVREFSSENKLRLSLNDGTYYWRVRAIDRAGNVGEWSTIGSFRIDATPPSVPIVLTPTDNFISNVSQITFSWQASSDSGSGIKNYQVQISTSIDFSTIIEDRNLDSTLFSITLSDGTYYWRVRAVDNAGNIGEWSKICRFSIDTKPPQIIEVTPTGRDISPDSIIMIIFNESIDAESAKRAISILPQISGDIRVENNILKFVPKESFVLGREYKVSVSGVKDVAGNRMKGSYSWGFVVAAPDIEISVNLRSKNATYVGDEVNFEIIIKNKGSWKASEVSIKVFVNEVEYSEIPVGEIEKNDEKTQIFKLKLEKKGFTVIKFVVLCDHDSYTGNNEKYVEIEVIEKPTPPPSWLSLLPLILLIIIVFLVIFFWRRKSEEFPMEEKGKEARMLAKTIEKAAEEKRSDERIEDIDLDSLFR